MKRIASIIALVFALSALASAQYYGRNTQSQQGGLFGYGVVSDEEYYGSSIYNGNGYLRDSDPVLPGLPGHGLFTDQSATPMGSGTLMLIGFGAAYLLKRRSKK